MVGLRLSSLAGWRPSRRRHALGEGGGGRPQQCGWLKDRYGLSWQVTPKRVVELLAGPDKAAARRAMNAVMQMVKLDIAAVERAAAGGAS